MLVKATYQIIDRNDRLELVKEQYRGYDPVEDKTFGKTETVYHINEIGGDWRDSYKTLREAKQTFRTM